MPVAFALPIKLSLSQPMSFLSFTFLLLSLITLPGVTEGLCGAELTAGVTSQQHSGRRWRKDIADTGMLK